MHREEAEDIYCTLIHRIPHDPDRSGLDLQCWHADCEGCRAPMKQDQFSIFQQAASLAAKAHQGQTIRSTEIPYISHPVRVAAAVANLFGCGDVEVAAAALLHDVLEKTTVTSEEIGRKFGSRVLHLVKAMTKEEGIRKKVYWELLAADVWEARLIKMADALDHLDCPARDLPRRIKSANAAIELAFSNEPAIRRGRAVLEGAVIDAEMRLKSLL